MTASFFWLVQANNDVMEPLDNGLQVKNHFFWCRFYFPHSVGIIQQSQDNDTVFVSYCRSLDLLLNLMAIIYRWKPNFSPANYILNSVGMICQKQDSDVFFSLMQDTKAVNQPGDNDSKVKIYFLVPFHWFISNASASPFIYLFFLWIIW